MSDQANQTPTSTETTSAVPSLDERIDSVFSASDPAGEAGSPESPSLNDTGSPAGSEAQATDPLAKARAERRAKLAELNARSRAAVDAKAAQREAEELRRRLAEAEGRSSKLVDPTTLDPLKIIELGQMAGHTPAAIAEALRNAMGSPELAAAHAAKQAVDPVVAKLQSDLTAALAKIDAFEARQAQTQADAEEREAAHAFASFTAQNASTSPLAARFLQTAGAEEFHRLTMGAVAALPPGAGPQALLDEIEDRLTDLQRIYMAPANPQRPQANPPRPTNAAAQAPTHVTNTLAQQRSSVVDEDAAMSRLSLEERAAIAFGS